MLFKLLDLQNCIVAIHHLSSIAVYLLFSWRRGREDRVLCLVRVRGQLLHVDAALGLGHQGCCGGFQHIRQIIQDFGQLVSLVAFRLWAVWI